MSNFSRNLVALREKKGFTQKTFAEEKLNIKVSTYASYEEDRAFPKPELLIKISEILKISIDKLLKSKCEH